MREESEGSERRDRFGLGGDVEYGGYIRDGRDGRDEFR